MYSSTACKYWHFIWPVTVFIGLLHVKVDVMLPHWQLFEVNVSAATQRKKEELHNRHAQLEKEREMLKHNKLEWVKQ